MKHIFVTNENYGVDVEDSLVAGLNTVDNLIAGAIVFINAETGNSVDPDTGISNNALPNALLNVCLSHGSSVNPDVIVLNGNNIVDIKKNTYSAPVAKVMAFGDEAKPVSFTPAAGNTYTIVIENRDKSIHQTDRKRYYTTIGRTGDTIVTVLNRLIAKINNDSLQSVTASLHNTDDGIKFRGTTVNNFGVFVMDDLIGAGNVIEAAKADLSGAIIDGVYYDANTPITLATKYGNAALDGAGVADIGYAMWNGGVGTPTHVAALEEELSSHKGDHKSLYRSEQFFNAPTNLDTTATYHIYDIEFNSGKAAGPFKAENFTQHLMIAAKSGNATLIADLETLFANYL
jgi:hypothetical protein